MKLHGRTWALVLGWTVAGIAAEPPVEFSGVLVTDGQPKVALRDKATGATRWLEPGARLHGYSLVSYSAKDDAIVLRKDGRDFRLTLVSPATPADPRARAFTPVVSVPVAPPPPIVQPPVAAAENPAPLPVTPPPAAISGSAPAGPAPPAAGEALASSSGNDAPATSPADPAQVPAAAGAEGTTAATPTPPATAAGAGEMTGRSATVVTRTAQPGESAASIARAAGLTLEQLRALNPSINPDSIQPGQPIRIR